MKAMKVTTMDLLLRPHLAKLIKEMEKRAAKS